MGTHLTKCLAYGSFSVTPVDSEYIFFPAYFCATQGSCFSSQPVLNEAPREVDILLTGLFLGPERLDGAGVGHAALLLLKQPARRLGNSGEESLFT